MPDDPLEISTIEELIENSKFFPRRGSIIGWFFRGQPIHGLPIVPKAGREGFFDQIWKKQCDEEKQSGDIARPPRDLGVFRRWTERAGAFEVNLPSNEFECLAVARHHGLATRLLDWSLNPLVAAFFATSSNDDRDGEIVVHLPGAIVSYETAAISDVRGVMAYLPRPVSKRVLAQAGVFTIHEHPEAPIAHGQIKNGNAFMGVNGYPYDTVNFRIPAASKKGFMRDLDYLGVNHSTLFPDLDGLSTYLNWEYNCAVQDSIAAALEPGSINRS